MDLFTNTINKNEEEVKEILGCIWNGNERKFKLLYTATKEENTKRNFS